MMFINIYCTDFMFQEAMICETCPPSILSLIIFNFLFVFKELAWLSGNVMDCHATARGSIPGRNGVFIELHVLRKGQ